MGLGHFHLPHGPGQKESFLLIGGWASQVQLGGPAFLEKQKYDHSVVVQNASKAFL